jgi:hypothetical protein
MCHASEVFWPGLTVAPKGVVLETDAQIAAHAREIYLQSGRSHAMPPGNVTGMDATERAAIVRWYESGGCDARLSRHGRPAKPRTGLSKRQISLAPLRQNSLEYPGLPRCGCREPRRNRAEQGGYGRTRAAKPDRHRPQHQPEGRDPGGRRLRDHGAASRSPMTGLARQGTSTEHGPDRSGPRHTFELRGTDRYARRRRSCDGRGPSGGARDSGIAIALVVATLLAGAAWWLTGTERWQEIAPTTVEEEGWIGDLAGGDLDALTEEELVAAERAWIERTTPGATGTAPAPPATAETDGTTGDDAVGTNAAVAQPPAPATQDAAAEAPPAALETGPAVPAEVAEPPEPPPVPAPSLIRSGGFPAGGTLPLGQDGVADVAGPGLSISPTRIGPMPRSSRPPAFRLPDSVEDLPPSLGRIVAWVAG